ncbi:GSCOCG00004853001-RA-CDS [Cotesia congregata]|uniref:Palmitoyltransferase n=1 Tax=Cotesia glomerata TaxID=32391 RepID=A0AAV7HVD1_COTGL|nr:synaptobrevin homolog YKT6 [Cotesia glomerata]XP_044578236.1 synaptobrevin homolog YKT6 [Cotesia glomerata]KAH0549184.1 palmitoyltransferase [Cotesia glomerata]CAD6219198.1 GSCOCG00004853001-RA-CDS [Cotesia congregata]
MVKLYALTILYKGPTSATALKSVYDVDSFSYFQRGSVKEFMGFVSKTITERTQIASRQSVKEGEYMCHVYVRGDSLAGVLISDHEYPNRVSHTLITKVLDEFAAKYPSNSWPTLNEPTCDFPQANVYLAKYQNPREADSLTKMQNDLDETKIILHSTLEAVLQRGEKLDDLVQKSEGLSIQSKAFYKTARKTNSCCSLTA